MTPAAPRAMWVWDRPAPSVLIGFAVDQHVGELFVHVATVPDVGWLREVCRGADDAGIGLQALGSQTSWIDVPERALEWRDAVAGIGLFDSVHLDVEPWLHPDWERDRDTVIVRYLHLLHRLTAEDLRLEVDISFWLHTLTAPGGTRLDAAVLELVDAVTIMSYRDTATGVDGITGVAATTLAAARAAARPVRLAVETGYLGPTPVDRKQTFHGARRSEMAAVLARVDAELADDPAYAGIAVHDRRGWSAMRP